MNQERLAAWQAKRGLSNKDMMEIAVGLTATANFAEAVADIQPLKIRLGGEAGRELMEIVHESEQP